MTFLKRVFRTHGNGEEEQQSDGRQGYFNHTAVNDADVEVVPRYPPPNHPSGSLQTAGPSWVYAPALQPPGSSSQALSRYQQAFGPPLQTLGSSLQAHQADQIPQQEVSLRDREVLQTIERSFEQLGHVMTDTIAQGHAGSFEINRTRDGCKFKPEHLCFACNQYIEEKIHQCKFAILKCIFFGKASRRKLESC